MENKIKQLRKGILELAILGHLTGGNGVELTEGTIYPILARLAREGLISAEWVESRQGPPRKYYALTEAGQEAHGVLETEFSLLRELVARASRAAEDADDVENHTMIEMNKEAKDDE